MYVFMYICMYVRTYICMYVRMYYVGICVYMKLCRHFSKTVLCILFMKTKRCPTKTAHADQHTALCNMSSVAQIKLFRI